MNALVLEYDHGFAESHGIPGPSGESMRYGCVTSATSKLPDGVHCARVGFLMLQEKVVATAERHMCIINLQQPSVIYKQMTSPLKWQTRTIACFPEGDGYAVGSVEGRVAMQFVCHQ